MPVGQASFGNKFDPNTGKPIPKFDPWTGKQNWNEQGEEAYGTELGGAGSWLSGSARGSASSSSTQPTLSQAVEILKRELGLEGNFKDVIEQAAAQLGVEPGPALAELAQQCLRELHPGKTQAV